MRCPWEGKPQRSIASSRPSDPLRTTGAIRSGNTPGSGGRLPVRSTMAPNASRIACWPLVMLKRLHMPAESAAARMGRPMRAGAGTLAKRRLDTARQFWIRSYMPEPPYDRALALAAQVRTMRDHFLDV